MNEILLISEDCWYKEDPSVFEYSWWDGKTANFEKINFKSSIFQELYKRMSTLFESYVDITGINIQRYRINEYLGAHIDNNDGHFKNGWHMRYGIVLYYNDNYMGGEIEYPDLHIVHKPKAGSLILHGGNIMHGTKPVLDNSVRYFSSCFVKGTKDKQVILNKNIFADLEESDGTTYR